ncbi:phosphatase PAP2 family protein [Vibrio ulleungensis]|uniref:undecaprenyl-diphosphate phosphatase n=1 Tax=Vibrio ulleungensis TaxID=2807619 RepID=A0ABS2HGS7_9VIBR|nr:phosphatase PAP2 family protein [Vibrio ulleungensis]MBM7036748.1 phosphatase PAP2 family protein [Vibrio ulleungensis]
MDKTTLSVLLASLFVSQGAYSSNKITETTSDDYVVAGDYLQIAIPATGLLAAWIYDDLDGAKQLTYSLATTVAIVHATKFSVGRLRPNASNTASFPSGHTAAAFSGAAFLQTRYGAAWGIPAYLSATYVGASRVYGNKHFADDVVAGAGIAFLTNQYFVSEYTPEGVELGVVPLDDGMMVNVNVSNEALDYETNRERKSGSLRKERRHSFTLDIGFYTYDTLADSGAYQSLKNTTPVDELQPLASALYQYRFDKQNALEISFTPSEIRSVGTVATDFSLGDQNYEENEELFIALRQWNAGASYIRNYQPTDELTLSAGLGISAYLIESETDLVNGGKYNGQSSYPILPSITGKLNYAFNDDWSINARVDYQALSGDRSLNAEGGFAYMINPDWNVGIKYVLSDNEWEDSNVEYRSESVLFSVTNNF